MAKISIRRVIENTCLWEPYLISSSAHSISVPIVALENSPQPLKPIRLILRRGSRGAKVLRVRLHSTNRHITPLRLRHITVVRQIILLAYLHILFRPELPRPTMVHPTQHELEIFHQRAFFAHFGKVDVQEGVFGQEWRAGPEKLVRNDRGELGIEA